MSDKSMKRWEEQQNAISEIAGIIERLQAVRVLVEDGNPELHNSAGMLVSDAEDAIERLHDEHLGAAFTGKEPPTEDGPAANGKTPGQVEAEEIYENIVAPYRKERDELRKRVAELEAEKGGEA